MNRTLPTSVATAVLAFALGGAASATPVQLFSSVPAIPAGPDTRSYLPDGGACNYSGAGCGQMVYEEFTLNSAATISQFTYYSYFSSDPDYVSTNWWFWSSRAVGGSLSPLTTTQGAPTPPPSSDLGDPMAVTISGFEQDFSAGTYWIGIQNNLANDSDSSDFATYDPNGVRDYNPPQTSFVGFISPTIDSLRGTYDAGALVVDGNVASAPEPSTWAMMLAGFAGLSWVARRRFARIA